MNCIFCDLDRAILVETELSLAFLDRFPVSQGHTLVIPRRHVVSLWEMTTEEHADAFNLVKQSEGFTSEAVRPAGIQHRRELWRGSRTDRVSCPHPHYSAIRWRRAKPKRWRSQRYFLARATIKLWTPTLLRSTRSSRWDRTLTRTNLPSGEPWRVSLQLNRLFRSSTSRRCYVYTMVALARRGPEPATGHARSLACS